MRDRKRIIFTYWFTSSLALLAFLSVAPFLTSVSAHVSSGSDYLCLDLALLPGPPTTYLSAVMATDAESPVNALVSENEEQDQDDSLEEPRVSFLIPSSSFLKLSDHPLIVPRSILSHYPLRC